MNLEHYEILGLTVVANEQQIKDAFIKQKVNIDSLIESATGKD